MVHPHNFSNQLWFLHALYSMSPFISCSLTHSARGWITKVRRVFNGEFLFADSVVLDAQSEEVLRGNFIRFANAINVIGDHVH